MWQRTGTLPTLAVLLLLLPCCRSPFGRSVYAGVLLGSIPTLNPTVAVCHRQYIAPEGLCLQGVRVLEPTNHCNTATELNPVESGPVS